MNKRVKWGIIIVIGAGLIGGGIYSQLPKENEELAAADKVMTGQRSGKKILNVNAKIIIPHLLKCNIFLYNLQLHPQRCLAAFFAQIIGKKLL